MFTGLQEAQSLTLRSATAAAANPQYLIEVVMFRDQVVLDNNLMIVSPHMVKNADKPANVECWARLLCRQEMLYRQAAGFDPVQSLGIDLSGVVILETARPVLEKWESAAVRTHETFKLHRVTFQQS